MGKRGRYLDVLAILPFIVFFTLLFVGYTPQVSGAPIPPALLTSPPVHGYKTSHVFIVVMDGVRYSETFGDPEHRFIPHLFNDLRPQGTLFTHYYNRGVTITRQGHSTLISGTWQNVPNGGPRLTRPTLFEYYRDEKRVPPMKCWSVFGKENYVSPLSYILPMVVVLPASMSMEEDLKTRSMKPLLKATSACSTRCSR